MHGGSCMPTGNPGIRRGRARCSMCGALGVKAPTCTGEAVSHALLARPYVEEEMGRDTPHGRPQYVQNERQWSPSQGWPLWETITEIEATISEPPEGWFSVGPVVAEDPVDADAPVEEISTLERIARALESIAKALK